jgi:putative membrane protein
VNVEQAIRLADAWGMHGDVGAGWWIVMMVFMVLFWGGIIFGIAWLVKGSIRGSSTPAERPATKESPVEILERRFAEGAISPEDYRTRLEVLAKGRPEPKGGDNGESLSAAGAAEGRQ